MQLYEETDQSAPLCLYILYFSFYFIFELEQWVVWLAKEFSETLSALFFKETRRSSFQTMILLLYLNLFYKTEHGVGSSPIWSSRCIVSSRLRELVLEMNSMQLAN